MKHKMTEAQLQRALAVKAFIEARQNQGQEMSLSALARAAGVSVSLVSQIISGTYAADAEASLKKLEAAVERIKAGEDSSFRAPQFIQTSVYQRIAFALDGAERDVINSITVLYGPSGIGKTRSLKHFASENANVILIEARADLKMKALMKKIAKSLRLADDGAINDIFDRIVDSLKERRKHLIIDEAEHLNDNCLELVRRIQDLSENDGNFSPITLMGMPELYKNISKTMPQISNRMASFEIFPPEETDLAEIARAAYPKAPNAIIEAFALKAKGVVRTMLITMQKVVRYAEASARPIDIELIDTFVAQQH